MSLTFMLKLRHFQIIYTARGLHSHPRTPSVYGPETSQTCIMLIRHAGHVD